VQYSYSRVDCFKHCPFKFKLRYIDELVTVKPTNADNALILGTALHTGIEEGVEAGIQAYYNSYPIIDDNHINEVMKLEYLIPKVQKLLPKGIFELQVIDTDFIGFIDLTAIVDDQTVDLYDFKYSNNVRNYLESGQLHIYKHFLEKKINKKIRNLYFVFIPKVAIKQKKGEELANFRKRIMTELEASKVKIVQIQFNPNKVIEFYADIKRILETSDFPKDPSYLCNWCEYQEYCEKDVDWMLLPKNERRNIEKILKKVVWLYGVPFSGKTALADKFPDPLMLNTDGNIKFVTAPYISIKDIVTVEGRQTKRTFAWVVFKETIDELEKKQNEFKTIIVDLLEDLYEHCRVFIYDREGITHESDNSFKFYDVVRTEFLSTLKRLMNLDYENIILISHEDTSKDITKKSGDRITAIKPNLAEKVANKVAGMVDIVARVIANGDERTLSFKTNEVIFGGGRLTVTDKVIPLDYNEFMKVYEEANAAVKYGKKSETGRNKKTDIAPAPAAEKQAEQVAPAETVDSSAQKVQEPERKEEKTEQTGSEPERKVRKKRGE
jgi:phage nucleotide-binding protein